MAKTTKLAATHVKARLVEITEWSRDERAIDGDASREGHAAVMRLAADEVRAKLEDCTFAPEGLPFGYDFDVEAGCEERLTEDEVKDRILGEYVERFCRYDYVKPTDCEIEWEITEECKR